MRIMTSFIAVELNFVKNSVFKDKENEMFVLTFYQNHKISSEYEFHLLSLFSLM